MLSRVADSLYWMSRYVERAENVARFVDVSQSLSLGGVPQWAPLVFASGDEELFQEHYGECNAENVLVLREFRVACKTLVAVGACAINGGLPAQRNQRDVGQMMVDVYCSHAGTVAGSQVPNDPELPLPLNKVHPIHEVVHVDYFLDRKSVV